MPLTEVADLNTTIEKMEFLICMLGQHKSEWFISGQFENLAFCLRISIS